MREVEGACRPGHKNCVLANADFPKSFGHISCLQGPVLCQVAPDLFLPVQLPFGVGGGAGRQGRGDNSLAIFGEAVELGLPFNIGEANMKHLTGKKAGLQVDAHGLGRWHVHAAIGPIFLDELSHQPRLRKPPLRRRFQEQALKLLHLLVVDADNIRRPLQKVLAAQSRTLPHQADAALVAARLLAGFRLEEIIPQELVEHKPPIA